jgi:hypothetical protein
VERHDWTSVISNEGWSPAYGSEIPSPVLRFHKQAQLPAEFVTLLIPTTNASGDLGKCSEIKQEQEAIQARGYTYSSPEGNHFFFFGESKRWELAGWSSDAAFLYCRLGLNNDLCHVIFCDGTFVENEGRPLFTATRRIHRCEWRSEGSTRNLFCSDDDALLCVAGELIAESEPVLREGNMRGTREGER